MQQVPNPNAVAIGFICGFVIAITVVSLIGGLILKVSVAWFNRMRGDLAQGMPPIPRTPEYRPDVPHEHAEPPRPGENPYAAPSGMTYTPRAPVQAHYEGRGAPIPSYGKAVGIVLLRAIIDRALGFVVFNFLAPPIPVAAPPMGAQPTPDEILQLVLDSMTESLELSALVTVVSFLIGWVILKGMLPTTFGRAFAIQLLEYLIGLAILIVMGIIALALFSALA